MSSDINFYQWEFSFSFRRHFLQECQMVFFYFEHQKHLIIGVKPFFRTPRLPRDIEAVAAVNETGFNNNNVQLFIPFSVPGN